MGFSRFFIDRPIFASVLSFLILLGGILSIPALPISEYPEVVPPSVVVSAAYPGANPTVIAETVAAPLEEQINGVEDMLYMSSQANSNGAVSITITFQIGTDIDLAQQLVQNRVNQALPRLPEEVRQIGVTVVKSSPDLTMVVHILSPDERYDNLYLRNFALLNVKTELERIAGVGRVGLFGSGDYAMRIWLEPEKVAARGLSAADIVRAIREQNVQVAAGIVGAPPVANGTNLQLSVSAQGRLQNVEEFENIILKTEPGGAVTRIKDVGRVELGASEYTLQSLLNQKPAVAVPVFQTPDANALDISTQVRETMARLKPFFPEGVDYKIVYDPTIFVKDSIKAVIHTLLEAIALVVLVVIVFLQTWRASIIPLLAVPVSIVGTFAVMLGFGFSINTLTLFGLVLAIGIVVDDAIVVVENVERNIEEGLSPREATYKAMGEVSGPIIAIALVLVAVFVPIAFISGLTGQFYKQFALTIAISTVISAINSLTLSPALAALLLKPAHEQNDWLSRLMRRTLNGFFTGFNHVFKRSSEKYESMVARTTARRGPALLLYVILLGLTVFQFNNVPGGFVPAQDKQYLIGFAQLPDATGLNHTTEVIHRMSEIAMKTPGVEGAVAFPGLNIAGFSISPNAGIVFITLKPFSERTSDELNGFAIAGNLNQQFAAIQDAFIAVFPPPPVRGIGMLGGFKLQLQDKADVGDVKLYESLQQVLGKSYQNPVLTGVFSGFQINVPQLKVEVDRTRAKQMGVAITDIFQTMQLYLGSIYVNDFNKFGRTYRVVAQADAPYRGAKEDILTLKVKAADGSMVPLASLITVEESFGPERATRYNGTRSADINGGAAPGYSSSEAQAAMVKILDETLPPGITYSWTDLAYQEILAGDTAIYIFPLCVLLVFLVLAAFYESLTLPVAVILIVPMCLLSALTGVWLTGGDNNIFTQVGLVVLMGLACKNAILIVEFARELEIQGKNYMEAALTSCRLRLRPILMTSFAFIMGVIPLVMATGAGSEMRHAIGITVFSGMLGVTFFGLLLTPVFYVALRYMMHGCHLTKGGH